MARYRSALHIGELEEARRRYADLEAKVAALVAAVVHCLDVMDLAERHADTHPLLLVEVSQAAWWKTFVAPLEAAVAPFKEATE